MIEMILATSTAAGALGTAAFSRARFWRGEYKAMCDTVASLRKGAANANLKLHDRDDAIRELNARLVPLEAREAKRLAQLRSICSKGGKAVHAKRKAARKDAVAQTMAALPSLSTMPSRAKVVAPVKAARTRKANQIKSDAGTAAA